MKISLSGKLVAFFVLLTVIAGCKKSDPVGEVAAVGTAPVVTLVTPTSVRVGGELVYSQTPVTSNGICWSATNPNPTTADTKVVVDSLVSVFGGKITGLTPGTQYFARAYAVNRAGTAYGSVVKFTTPTTTFNMQVAVSTFSGNGSFGYADGAAGSAMYNGPQTISFNAVTGNLQVADVLNNAIRLVSATGDVTTLTGTDRMYINGPLADARFYGARATVTDATGNIFVADAGNNAIRKITPGGMVSTYAGSPTGDYGYADATSPSKALFRDPRGLALDATGNLYVADYGNNCIRKITPAGKVSTLAGVNAAGYVNYDSDATAVRFNGPIALTLNSTGLYVADQNNKAIRKVDINTGATSTAAGGSIYPDQIGTPQGITTDAAGNLYIADRGGRILKLTAQKILYTLAGKLNTSGFINGSGTDARFNWPTGVALDGGGNIYVSDFNNNVIRKVVVTITP